MRQSQDVANTLQGAYPGQGAEPGLQVELTIIKTSGDRFTEAPLAKIGGKGLFVKEIEDALLAKRIDLAVHSLKDMPAELAAGLCIGAVSRREDARDALLLAQTNGEALGLEDLDSQHLPNGATVGTSSLRRKAQLLRVRPDLRIVALRGNLDTRLRKLHDSEIDAIILAAAGLHRMGWSDAITAYLEPSLCLPAIGQGALGIEIREDDAIMREIVSVLHDAATAHAVAAERALLRCLSGSCQIPIAGYAEVNGAALRLRGMLAGLDGASVIAAERSGMAEDAAQLGNDLGEEILARGGRELLADILAAADAEDQP